MRRVVTRVQVGECSFDCVWSAVRRQQLPVWRLPRTSACPCRVAQSVSQSVKPLAGVARGREGRGPRVRVVCVCDADGRRRVGVSQSDAEARVCRGAVGLYREGAGQTVLEL